MQSLKKIFSLDYHPKLISNMAELAIFGAFATNVIISSISAFILYSFLPHNLIYTWLFLHIILFIGRIISSRKLLYFLKKPDSRKYIQKYCRLYLIGTLLTAILYAVIIWFIYIYNVPDLYIFLMTIVIILMAASSISTLGSVIIAFILFVSLSVTPLIILSLSHGEEIFLILAIILFFYMILHILFGYRQYIMLRNTAFLEETFKSIYEKSSDGIMLIKDNRFYDSNETILKMFGYSTKEEFLTTHVSKFMPKYQPDGKRSIVKMHEMVKIALKNGTHSFEWVHQTKDGELFWTEIVLTRITLDADELLHGVWRDISERKRLEDENTTLKERMELALLGYKAGVYEWNLSDNSVYISPQWKEMVGYSDDELPNLFSTWADRVHPDDLEAVMLDVQQTIDAKKEHLGRIHRLKHRNGQWIWILGRGIIQYDEHGKALRMVGIQTDISEQKNLQLKSDHQSQIIDQINDSVISTDLDGNIVSWNLGSEWLFGYRADEVIGKHISMLHRQEDIPTFKESIVTLLKTGGYNADLYLVTKSKEIVSVALSLSLLKDENGVPLNMVGYARDITERKKAEEALKKLNNNLEEKIKYEVQKSCQKDQQLIYQSRLAQMGEMISMIAHQWRQPLAAISATSASIELKASLNKLDNDTAQQKAQDISNFSQHLSKTINDFRNFFKPNKEKIKTSYDELISSVREIIGISIRNKNIELIQELNCHDRFIAYPNELKQVILNLIKNAEDALLEKKIENPYIKISTYKENDKYILEVSDNAGGIPENIIENIFDPYFSTKTQKEGTGLGLYMSKTIIEEHCDGELSVSNSNDGAVFRIVQEQMEEKRSR